MSGADRYREALGAASRPPRRRDLRERIQVATQAELARRRSTARGAAGGTQGSRAAGLATKGLALVLASAAAVLVAVLWGPAVIGSPSPTGEVEREYATAEAERLELTLVDGTSVTLGSTSRLRVLPLREGEPREAHLEGVALFEVAHDPARPFIVRTGTAVTRVLGTQFVIRAFPGERAIGVAVAEGRVAVLPDGTAQRPAVVLNSGQVGRLGADGMFEVTQDPREVSRFLSWTEGPIHFRDRPLSEVLHELERFHAVTFSIPDAELAARPLTIRLQRDRLHETLTAISLAVHARYERSGDTITFRPLE